MQNNACSFLVRDYVTMGRAPYLKLLSMPSQDDYALADQAMERLNITHLADKSLQQISGGERRRRRSPERWCNKAGSSSLMSRLTTLIMAINTVCCANQLFSC